MPTIAENSIDKQISVSMYQIFISKILIQKRAVTLIQEFNGSSFIKTSNNYL